MIPTARTLRTSLLVSCFLLLPLTSFAQTSTETTLLAPACKVANDLYTCNQASFQKVLGQAKTAAIETGPVDPAGQTALKKLFTALGLVESAGEPADLTFLLSPVAPRGVEFSTGDTQIAALHIFARRAGPGRGDLIWAENFIGPEDLPWPVVANRLVLQFRSRFHIKDAPKGK